MATTKPRQTAVEHPVRSNQRAENPKEITRDIVEYLTEYAKENPGYAALGCIGVGFVLGWKLKLW
jgi:hypothetical protein